MKRALKITGIALGSALLLLTAAAAGLKLYFTPARLKALTAEYASRNLRREVSFDSVSLKLSGLSITKLKVSEYPDFRKGEFFSADSFSVRPSLGALLRRQVRINSVSADGLRMRVTEVRKDTYNFSDLITAQPAQKAPQPQEKRQAPAPLAISSLKVRNSRFTYANAAGDMTVTLRDIALSASGISPDALFPLDGSFTMDVASPYFTGSLPARLKGRVSLGNWDPARGRAEIDSASLSLGGVKAELKGSLEGLLEPDAKLSVSVKPFSTADLKTVFKGLPAKVLLPEIDADADFKLKFTGVKLRSVKFAAGPVKGSLSGSAAWEPAVTYDIAAELKAQTPELDTTILARKVKQLPIPRGFKVPLSEITAKARFRPGAADLETVTLETDGLSAQGRLRVSYPDGGALRAAGTARADIKNLARVAAAAPELTAPYAPSGTAQADLSFSYGGGLDLKGQAVLQSLGASFAGKQLSGLSGRIDFTKDTASAKALKGKLDGEDLSASFTARSLTTHPKVSFALKLDKLALKDLPAGGGQAGQQAAAKKQPAAQFYMDVAGKAEIGAIEHPNFSCGQVTATMDLVNISDDLKSLDGEATFSAGAGKFTDLYALAGKHKAAKVALMPLLVLQKASKLAKGLKLPDFNNIDFQSIEGDYFFLKGLMKINKSALVSPVADASSSGSVNLPAETLDMKIGVTLKEASGIRMSAPVAMNVRGTFAEPSVKLDMKSLVEQPAVKKAAEKLAPAAEKLLKNLFKK
jgi:hypothetical protein